MIPDWKAEPVDLDVIMVAARRAIDKKLLLLNCEAHVREDMVGNIWACLTQELLGGCVENVDIERRWPSDWWQAFKERWFPKWWLKRWPVNYQTISVHRRIHTRVCPHFAIQPGVNHVRFLMGKDDQP